MDILEDMYYKTAAANERNLRFWNDYLQNLKSLDFSVYSDKLKVPILVPIGSRIMFRGELKHTNEVTVALGADYFAKCSIKQADVIRQHRIKGAQEKVDSYTKEKEYLEKQRSFTRQNIYENQGQEIIEYLTEDEENTWREKHRENVRQYMQKRGKEKENEKPQDNVTDEELWNRLEELELQEELENELLGTDDAGVNLSSIRENKKDTFVVKEEDYIKIKDKEPPQSDKKDEVKAEKEMRNKKVTFKEADTSDKPSKEDLLQKIIDRQDELSEKLEALTNRARNQTKTESDLMLRLDGLELLDELEDEINRWDEFIENDDIEESDEEDSSSADPKNVKRRVSFVDEDDNETLQLTFKHSREPSNDEPYDPVKGIQKPSDIYAAHSQLFGNETTSILKKSKYATANDELPEMLVKSEDKGKKHIEQPVLQTSDYVAPQTIVVKDVIEKVGQNDNKLETENKPMSLFKKKRMQNKS